MRTTVDIEEDVLETAKELARQQRISTGQVISRLLRDALCGRTSQGSGVSDLPAVGGFRPFPAQGVSITNKQINQLRDTEGV